MSERAASYSVDTSPGEPRFEFQQSRQFVSWLEEQDISLAFTTYQAGKVFFVGRGEPGALSFFERTLSRCMGMTADEHHLYISTLYQFWTFRNVLPPGGTHQGYDRVYSPQLGNITGDLDIHDLGIRSDGTLVFVNTLFSCLAELSDTHSFKPLWKPPFISKLAAEDRCHLNGLAMRDGKPAFVTAVAQTDVGDGWREHRRDGGCVIDVESKEVVVTGLSMPHSPRFHGGKLWLHNSGRGEFGYVDLEAGRFEPVAFCPGYLRGLTFSGDFAVMGLSKARGNKTFEGLELQEALAQKGVAPRCALQVVDLRTGDAPHFLRMEGLIEELYDVVALPGVRRAQAIGFQTDEVRRVISIEG